MQFIFKTIISAILISLISIVSKKYSLLGAIIASLPISSILAMIWLYTDTKDVQKVIELSTSIFWVVLPSLVFFIAFPVLLKKGIHFYLALGLSCVIMIISYYAYTLLLKGLGIQL